MSNKVIEIYCDESHPDVLSEKASSSSKYLMIGSLWIDSKLREEIKTAIKGLKKKYNAWGELKWKKVSMSKVNFYKELTDLFVMYGEKMRFSCIAVDKEQIDMKIHKDSPETAFYKFYYQLLWKWIAKDFDSSYIVFCDIKTNKNKNCYKILKRCLIHPAQEHPADIKDVCALNSKESVLLQFSDFLLGIASAVMNDSINTPSAKKEVISNLEFALSREIKPTPPYENKYNIFKINFKKGRE